MQTYDALRELGGCGGKDHDGNPFGSVWFDVIIPEEERTGWVKTMGIAPDVALGFFRVGLAQLFRPPRNNTDPSVAILPSTNQNMIHSALQLTNHPTHLPLLIHASLLALQTTPPTDRLVLEQDLHTITELLVDNLEGLFNAGGEVLVCATLWFARVPEGILRGCWGGEGVPVRQGGLGALAAVERDWWKLIEHVLR